MSRSEESQIEVILLSQKSGKTGLLKKKYLDKLKSFLYD